MPLKLQQISYETCALCRIRQRGKEQIPLCQRDVNLGECEVTETMSLTPKDKAAIKCLTSRS